MILDGKIVSGKMKEPKEIKVETIIIKLDKRKLKLTLEEAKKLKSILEELYWYHWHKPTWVTLGNVTWDDGVDNGTLKIS